MSETTTIPIYRNGRVRTPGFVGQPVPKGTLEGSIVVSDDELTFEAYKYSSRPMLIATARTFTAALSAFSSKNGPPHPGVKPGGIADRARKRLYNP